MTDIDMPTEPMVYICMRHKWFGRLPILRNRRRFHVDLEKPLRLFNFGDLVVIEDFLSSWWTRATWNVVVYRDKYPEEY